MTHQDKIFSVKKIEVLPETTENSVFSQSSNKLMLEADNALPHFTHQNEVKNYFSFKRIEASTDRKYPFLKVLRIGKGKFLELPKLPRVAMGVLGMVLISGFLWWQSGSNSFFADSVFVDAKSPLAFDGAVYPFEKAPNWFKTGGKNSRLYSDYADSELVPAPQYNINLMQKDDWEKNIVNTKITYPIVYMGKYEYDHLEQTGSHPGVDIKLPTGTPVLAIANGIVVKSQDLTSGFGKHIVVRHDGVPTYGTVYSSYSHLSKRNVEVGAVVKKGEHIAEVGTTGNSTTSHIHFQIDLASAPFHPYWPFTSAEAKSAKVDFFEAVNIGLGKEKGNQHTIHPFEFIHANLSPSVSVKSVASATPKATEKPTVKATEKPSATPTVFAQTETLSGYSVLVAPSKIIAGDALYLSIYAKNQNGKWCASCTDSGTITYQDAGKTQKISYDLKNGALEQKIILVTPGKTIFTIKGKAGAAETSVEIVPRPTSTATPKPTVAAKTTLSANALFKDVAASHENAKAIAFLKQKNIINGYADGSFKPDNHIKRSEALKIIFGALNVGTNRNIKNPFTDVAADSWYKPYITTAYDLGLAQGYSDGTFQPEKTVTRSEFFKILAKTLHVDVSKLPAKNPFADVEKNTWVAPYAQWAKENNLLNFGVDFLPNQKMTRGEMAEALYRISK